jgi:hypothetical protein
MENSIPIPQGKPGMEWNGIWNIPWWNRPLIIRGSRGSSPASFFFSKTSGGNTLFGTSKILVVIWSDRASGFSQKSRLADFEIYDFAPPPQRRSDSSPIRRIRRSLREDIFDPSHDGSPNYRDIRT